MKREHWLTVLSLLLIAVILNVAACTPQEGPPGPGRPPAPRGPPGPKGSREQVPPGLHGADGQSYTPPTL